MKFLATLSAAALFALASAVPAPESVAEDPANVEVPADIPTEFPSINGQVEVHQDGESVTKRELNKRGTLVVDVYYDLNGAGRHQGLWTDTQKCYNLGNGWDDQITSLRVPNGFGCLFYEHPNCRGKYLTVPGGNFVGDLRVYGMDDQITSYLCWD